MDKGLDCAINRFPEKEKLILRLYQCGDFQELCEHYALMKNSAALEPIPEHRLEYERLRDVLEDELQDYLSIKD